MSKLTLFFICIGFLFQLSHAQQLEPTSLSTEDIVGSFSADSTCLNYCVTGVCVWLHCSLSGCQVETSIRIRHNNPDLVISVYGESGDNPWSLAATIYGNVEMAVADSLVGLFHDVDVGGGYRVEGGHRATDQSLRFMESTAIGHPLSSLSNAAAISGYFCPSEATSFYPYFSSSFDALSWRLGIPEMLYISNLLPGRRVVGEGLHQQWGAVWPRTGFINQKDDVKAAAVVAQRVGNIVTQTGQPHIYTPLRGNGYNRSWLPGQLIENDRQTGVWQMLAPQEDRQCYVFGENDVFHRSWSEGRHSEDSAYVFSLWRPYECCRAEGAYLFTVPTQVCI